MYVKGTMITLSLLVAGAIIAACSGSAQGTEGVACYPNDTCNSGLVCNAGTCVRSEGKAGGACYPNDTCDSGLVCKAGTCVASGGTGGHGGGGGAGTGGAAGGMGGSGGASGAATSSSSSSSGSTTSSSSSSGAPPNQPPLILTFGTNVTSITQGQQVTFTAVVTDPDGIDDVIGGTLLDASGATYGAFATSAQEGSYQVAVTWDQINQVASIDFAPGATPTRSFKAQFFDQGGHMVEKNVDLTLTCNGKAACAGKCVDLMTDKQNCGACAKTCGGMCTQGKCPALTSACTAATTCANYCASIGKTCFENACINPYGGGYVSGISFGNSTCTQYSGTRFCTTSTGSSTSLHCCCG